MCLATGRRRAEARLDFLGNRFALERRARPADEAPPDARLLRARERRFVAAHDVMLDGEGLAAETTDARAHLAAVTLERRGEELALRRDERHGDVLALHPLRAVADRIEQRPARRVDPSEIGG